MTKRILQIEKQITLDSTWELHEDIKNTGKGKYLG